VSLLPLPTTKPRQPSVRHKEGHNHSAHERYCYGKDIAMRFTRVLLPVLVALSSIVLSSAASAQVAVGVSIAVAPPLLPVYDQPPMPDVGYIWTPGYWAYGAEGYYWVPGTWVLPPSVGLLWTPPYWGWSDGVYVLHAGYWGPHVGFYGGINYGFGYGGVGYGGGYWEHGVFSYNRTVNNFGNVNVTNVYNKTVINNTSVTNVSFNGGTGGTTAQASAEEEAAAREQHSPPTPLQAQHEHVSSTNQALLASVNHGQPAIGATSRPGELQGHGIVGTRDGTGGTHAPAAMHAPGEPGAQHALSPATTSHPPGHPNGGMPPHQTNAPTQHPVGNVNTTTNNQLHPANNQLHPANNPPPHPANNPPPHPTNQARISNPSGMTHPIGGAAPHPAIPPRPPAPAVQRPPPHPPAHAAAGGNQNQNKKPKQ
jgi:hypothetical protein